MVYLDPILRHVSQHFERRTFPIIQKFVPANPHQTLTVHDAHASSCVVVPNEPCRWILHISKNLFPSVLYRFFRTRTRMTVNDIGISTVETNAAVGLNNSTHIQVPSAIVVLVMSIEVWAKADTGLAVDPRQAFKDNVNARHQQFLLLAPEPRRKHGGILQRFPNKHV